MGIQSSINSLLSQAQRLATYYSGFNMADDMILNQEFTKNEARLQTEISAGIAPMKDGKVDPEWLQKRRDEYDIKAAINDDGSLTEYGKQKALTWDRIIKLGGKPDKYNKAFYKNKSVQNYLKSFNGDSERMQSALDSAISAQSTNSELKNDVARKVARYSVKSRTDSINKTKSNFDAHTASLIKYYSKGSGNP